MATTKIWKIVKRLDHVIDYATNKEKTENVEYAELHKILEYAKNSRKTEKQFYVTGLNCSVDIVYEEMAITKATYSKKDGIQGYHAYQSFKQGETTPEIAHEIGKKLAEELWGDRFEVVVSTHLNTKCLHNHYVLNSVSFADGKKYYDDHKTYARMRQVSDSLCAEYGLSVLEEKKCKGSNLNYANFQKDETVKYGYVNIAKTEIDRAIEMAKSYADFESILKQMDYNLTYRAGKLSVCREPYKRNIRIERAFGEEYSIANIKTRIANTDRPRVPFLRETTKRYNGYSRSNFRRQKPIGKLARLHLYYCYLLKIYPKVQYTKKVSALLRKDVKIMDEYSKNTRFLCSRKIDTTEELFLYKNNVKEQLRNLETLRESCTNKYRYVKTDEDRAELKSKVDEVTHKISLLRKEEKICIRIEETTPKIKENIIKIEEIETRKEKMKDDKRR